MRRSADFSAAVRAGRRARSGALVVHLAADRTGGGDPALVGLVVGRSVGPSVVRHRVSRRLRAQLAGRLAVLEPGSATVVRALPQSALSSSAQLGRDLDAALDRLVAGGPAGPGAARVGR